MAERTKQDSRWEKDIPLEQWVPDLSNPDIKKLSGFVLGRSDREDYYRLYITTNLNHYIEFRKEDTVHAHQLHSDRTLVWVKPGTKIYETVSQSAPVEFLQGQIRRGFLRGTSGLTNMLLMAADCPGSGCAHCTAACSSLPGGGGPDTGFTCGC